MTTTHHPTITTTTYGGSRMHSELLRAMAQAARWHTCHSRTTIDAVTCASVTAPKAAAQNMLVDTAQPHPPTCTYHLFCTGRGSAPPTNPCSRLTTSTFPPTHTMCQILGLPIPPSMSGRVLGEASPHGSGIGSTLPKNRRVVAERNSADVTTAYFQQFAGRQYFLSAERHRT